MNAEMIAVGTELLLGQITNTNAQFISEELALTGHNMYYHTVVGDNPQRLSDVIRTAQKRANLIIITGGLGPTQDDLTKKTIADVLGLELVRDAKAEEVILNFFKRRGDGPMTANNLLQADVIEGADVLDNVVGFAPGMMLEHEGVTYILMPGVPTEMKTMFTNEVRNRLEKAAGDYRLESRVLHFYGIGESRLADQLDDLITKQTNPTLGTYAGKHEVTLRITASSQNAAELTPLIDELEEKVLSRLGAYFFGYDGESLEEKVVRLLTEQNLTVSAAESLTAGLFQATLASVPGASRVLRGGLVTYATDTKTSLLGVPEELLTENGVVSEANAKTMANNVRQQTAANIGVSFTGVAGPGSHDGEPSGSVWIGFSDETSTTAKHHLFARDRQYNRERAVKEAFWQLYKYLEEKTAKTSH